MSSPGGGICDGTPTITTTAQVVDTEGEIDGQTFYCAFGEFEDGTLGEIFITAHKEGTFGRGNLDSLARMTSIALQCGAALEDVVKALRHSNYPPNGEVTGTPTTTRVSSIADWIAQEIEANYIRQAGNRATGCAG